MVHEPHEKVLYADEVFRIQGAVFEVNRVLGAGFLESVYQEALSLEFETRRIPFVAKPQLAITYKDARLKQTYAPDFICFSRVIVELKAVREIAPEHRAQTINYLKTTGLRVALLVNFGGLGRGAGGEARLVTTNPHEPTRTFPTSAAVELSTGLRPVMNWR